DRLNQVARDVLQGMELAEQLGRERALEACSQLDPKRASAHIFGIGAGSVHLGVAPMAPRSRWGFVFSLGRGFGAGYSKTNNFERNAVLAGKGLYLSYWHWHQYVEGQSRRSSHPAMDRGLGVMIWLGSGADTMTSAALGHSFPSERQPDIWKGLGLAMSVLAYVGGLRPGSAGATLEAAGPMAHHLVEGVAFGALQRDRLQDVDAQIEQVCREVSGEPTAVLIRASNDRFAD